MKASSRSSASRVWTRVNRSGDALPAVRSTEERHTIMKSSALGALAALTLITFAAGTARADSPYPPSTVITGVDWDRSSYRSAGDGGDIWATASASDGKVYAAWGDGKVTCPDKVSYGVAILPSAPGATLRGGSCGPNGSGK